MNNFLKGTIYIVVLSIASFFLIEKGNSEHFRFLPTAAFWADFSIIAQTETDFTSVFQKGIEIDIAQMGQYIASFLVHERVFTSDRFQFPYYPYRIDYVMEYFKLSRRFNFFSIGAFFDHVCYNTINTMEDTDAYQLRWYGVGIQFFTEGMKPGNRTIFYRRHSSNFELLLIPHVLLSTTFPLHTEQFRYRNKTSASFRLDICSLYGFFAYSEANAGALIDDEVRIDRSFEFGFLRPISTIAVSCFAQYQFKNDVLLYRGESDAFFYYGFRIESITDISAIDGLHRVSKLPHLRCGGGYGKRIRDEYLGYLTEIGADLDFIQFGPIVMLFSVNTVHYSKSEGNALYPRYLFFDAKGGIEYFFLSNILMGIEYKHIFRCDGNEFRGYTEGYELLGIYLLSRGMRRAESEYAYKTVKNGFLLHFEYKLYAGHITQSSGWGYDAIYTAAIRWDFYSWRFIRNYFAIEGTYNKGEINNRSWLLETGIRMQFNAVLMLYCRYERTIDINQYGGSDVRSPLIGFRIEWSPAIDSMDL